MQNKLNPIIQSIALVIVPVLVVLLFNFIIGLRGQEPNNSIIASTLKTSLFVVPNALFIIFHKYKLSYLNFVVAALATYFVVNNIVKGDVQGLNTFSLYLFNFIYFVLLIGVTYLSYFKITGFKLKNMIFIIGGIITHTLSISGIFLMNKQPYNMDMFKDIISNGANTFLMIGLAIAIGLLFFELPSPPKEAEYGYYDDDEDDNQANYLT